MISDARCGMGVFINLVFPRFILSGSRITVVAPKRKQSTSSDIIASITPFWLRDAS